MMINEPGKVMVRLPKGHLWTTEHIKTSQPRHVSCAAQSAPPGALSSAGPVPAAERRSMRYRVLGCNWTEKNKRWPKLESSSFCAFARVQTWPPLEALYTRDTGDSQQTKSYRTGKLHLLSTRFTFCTFLDQYSNSKGR